MTPEDKVKAAFKNGNGDKGNPGNVLPTSFPNSVFPIGNHGYPSPYGVPAYALYPAGTHYVPVPIHTGVQFPGNNLGGSILPGPIVAPGLGYLGSHIPGMSTLPIGGLSNPFSGLVPPYVPMGGIGGITSLKGPEGLPAYLAQVIHVIVKNLGQTYAHAFAFTLKCLRRIF